jgi:DNA-binding response OmpR family regulator
LVKLSNPQGRLRVLLVEDDELLRELFQLEFESWDLPVDCTWMSSAMEALMDVASMRPDLLITDLVMPGVDGFELIKALKRNVELEDMHVIVVTGMQQDAFDSRGGLPEDASILQKPVDFGWLRGYMNAMVSAKRKKQLHAERVKARIVNKAAARSVQLRDRATARLAQKLSQ